MIAAVPGQALDSLVPSAGKYAPCPFSIRCRCSALTTRAEPLLGPRSGSGRSLPRVILVRRFPAGWCSGPPPAWPWHRRPAAARPRLAGRAAWVAGVAKLARFAVFAVPWRSPRTDPSTLHGGISDGRARSWQQGRGGCSRCTSRLRCPAGGHARHARASCAEGAERAGRHIRNDICDLWDVMADLLIFVDVSSVACPGRTFYPAQGFHHRPTHELSQVDLPRRTPLRSVNHDFWCRCDCILLCWPTRSLAAIAARRNCSDSRDRAGRQPPRPPFAKDSVSNGEIASPSEPMLK